MAPSLDGREDFLAHREVVEVPWPLPEWVPLVVVVAGPAVWRRAGPVYPDPDGVRRFGCSPSVAELEAVSAGGACMEYRRLPDARPCYFLPPSQRREGAFDDVVGNAEQEVNGEEWADFTDAVLVIEHQPTTLGKVCHHKMKGIVDLRMLYPFPLTRALEVVLKLYFFLSQSILLGYHPLDVNRKGFLRFSLHRRMTEDHQIFPFTTEAPAPRSCGRKTELRGAAVRPCHQVSDMMWRCQTKKKFQTESVRTNFEWRLGY